MRQLFPHAGGYNLMVDWFNGNVGIRTVKVLILISYGLDMEIITEIWHKDPL